MPTLPARRPPITLPPVQRERDAHILRARISQETLVKRAKSGLVIATNVFVIRCLNPTHSSVSDGSLVCFSCRSLTELKYCNILERCSPNLGCYVERYLSGSHPRYNSGCVKPSLTCDMMSRQHGTCAACCNTSLCNSQGCGDSGFGIQGTRGPLCYECEHIGNPADCGSIRQCTIGQVCHVTEFPLGNNDSFYSMGCKSKDVCSSSASSLWTPDHAIVGRSAPTCSRCCEQDFCNLNCAENLHSQTTPLSKPTTLIQSTQTTTHTTNRATVKLTTFKTIPTGTTRRPPITLPPVQHTCYTCGDSTPDTCEYQYEETPCNSPNNYCMNIVTNTLIGTRTLERKCASFDDCYSNWWQGSSDEELCQTYTSDVSLTANFQCSFCCIENKCNKDIKPPRNTLYQDN